MSENADIEQPETTTESSEGTPPWGDDFDAQRAWSQIQNLRGDKDRLSTELSQAAADREELETLRTEKLTADEKALQDATTKAAQDARNAAESDWRPKYQAAQLKSAAAQVITDKEQLKSFMAITDPAKFADEDGEIDEDKVMSHLTTIFGARQEKSPQHRSWGQHSGGTGTPVTPGDAGKAEAQRRFGTT